MTYDVVIDGVTHRVQLEKGESTWLCRVDERELEVDAALTARDVLSVILGGKAYEIKRERSLTGEIHMIVGSARYAAEVHDPRSLRSRRAAAGVGEGPQKLLAPMPGKVVRILVAEKDEVRVGQGLIVVEAMKMQNELKSPKTGIVQKIMVAEGANVNSGDGLAIVE
ncbi:MAG TPA: biotin/lipoyl-containing protein [Clostridia bacterium]|nr:biotin/lipoyl-containing protein [Clostridia bacterium]